MQSRLCSLLPRRGLSVDRLPGEWWAKDSSWEGYLGGGYCLRFRLAELRGGEGIGKCDSVFPLEVIGYCVLVDHDNLGYCSCGCIWWDAFADGLGYGLGCQEGVCVIRAHIIENRPDQEVPPSDRAAEIEASISE